MATVNKRSSQGDDGSGRSTGRHDYLRAIRVIILILLSLASAALDRVMAGDLGYVPLLNGERSDSLNLWGGAISPGNITSFAKQSTVVHSGTGAYEANLGSVPNGGFRFFQTFSSSLDGGKYYHQDRDLTQFQTLEGYVRNDTAVPLTFSLELKDWRDDNSQVAVRSYTVQPGGAWQKIEAPLDLSSGWNKTGNPDITRTFAVSFLVNTSNGAANGSLYLDDFALIEKGPSIDVAMAPIQDVVERLARRQFMALWASRNKTSGLIPNSSNNTSIAALNTTTGVVWNLPSVIRHGWVTQADADAFMGKLITSLNTNRNQTAYLPSRMLDLVTAAPVTDHEESTIDASFLALALHNYKQQSATPAALATSIDAMENRFNFAVFAGSGAYNMAYFQPPGKASYFSGGTYSGYTNENKVIALAAALSTAHNVPLASMWNKDVARTLATIPGSGSTENYLVFSPSTEYRAPFVQALLNLFVDTTERGADNYSNRSLARNPWENFVRYEADAAAKLSQLGRPNFMQPDAGAGADTYKPWNLFEPNNFGQPNLFQPWSVAEMLFAGVPGAEDALRYLLDYGLGNGLDGPFGLADSAQWATGAANPTSVPSFSDNWNATLSLMSLMAWLDGANRTNLSFAKLPEVKAALDTVFIAGDYNGNGVVDLADYNYWKSTYGSINLLAADGNNNGVIDMADYVVWRQHYSGPGVGAGAKVPESATFVVMLIMGCSSAFASRFRRTY